ncbi:restriction endonuclease subunit S [Aliarcobacter cryaerophilus]|uniref:restriction endonuclease subunit S n=1 Tax=Aliarcobacter cryaerophilus TaxID=28198 RepID=UPI003DA2BBEF
MNKEIKQGYKQTKVGIIPKDWEVVKLGKVTKINPNNKNLPENFIYIDLESVVKGKLLKQNFISKHEAPSRAQRVLKKNDILFQMVRPYQMNNLFFEFDGNYVASTGYAQIRTNQSDKYIFQYIHLKRFVDKVLEKCTGSNYPAINSSDLSDILIILPPLKEQEKIAEILTTWDEAITKQTELLRAKELQKKGLIQKLLSGEVRFRGFSDEWEDIRLGQLPLIVSDGNYGEMYPKSEDFKDLGVPFLRANNIKNLSIDSSDTKYISNEQHLLLTSGHLRTNDILITTRGDIGNIALVDSRFENANINAQICLIRIRDNSKVYYRFLLYFLDSVYCKSQYKELETGSALKQLPKGNLAKLKIKLPSLPEQQKIAEVLSLADDEINLLKNELEKLNLQKKALMQKLLTGQVRVKV